MRYESLVSVMNLELAWRRINTGRNLQYKRFFRPVYLAYEAGLKDNLRLLRRELLAGKRVTAPTRTYLPKPSGLQRPITLLHLEDQILLQAVANIIAEKLRTRRARIEGRTVFSNILNTPGDSIFFIHRWQETYSEFLEACSRHFNDGYRWVAHFDLAAFYDTISHVQLVRLVAPHEGQSRTWQRVQEWLSGWTTYDNSPAKQHGIPQGPVASNFLAEAFLLPIDEQMSRLDVRYARYVDDIRILGRTKADVQAAAITLELACHSHGLIPQGKKFAIKQAERVHEILGLLPSIPPDGNPYDEQMPREEAERIFREALGGKPLRVEDKSRVRYILYRAPKSTKILRWVLTLMPTHLEHIDAFSHYLTNYARSRNIVRSVYDLLRSGVPYPYVRGELWHVLARIAPADFLRARRPEALTELRCAGPDVALRWGLLHFLVRCEREGFGRISRRLLTQHAFTQALLADQLPIAQYAAGYVAESLLRQKRLEPSLAMGRVLRERGQSLREYTMRSSDLPDKVQNAFRGLGVIRKRMLADRDYVGELLVRMYACSVSKCWRGLLGTDYEYALQILLEAEAAFNIDRSGWMRNQNAFNDMLVRAFIHALHNRALPGGSVRTVDRRGELVSLGVILQIGSAFDAAQPVIAAAMRDFNNRRNRLPSSHPYDTRSGAQNRFLARRERDTYAEAMKGLLNEIAAYSARAVLT